MIPPPVEDEALERNERELVSQRAHIVRPTDLHTVRIAENEIAEAVEVEHDAAQLQQPVLRRLRQVESGKIVDSSGRLLRIGVDDQWKGRAEHANDPAKPQPRVRLHLRAHRELQIGDHADEIGGVAPQNQQSLLIGLRQEDSRAVIEESPKRLLRHTRRNELSRADQELVVDHRQEHAVERRLIFDEHQGRDSAAKIMHS
ncbi:MAG: hypothetical protein CME06_18090 [Gemmatimonadetes bacterium]|nr:hypothetical protein [Gemmatimonadota bacterium]